MFWKAQWSTSNSTKRCYWISPSATRITDGEAWFPVTDINDFGRYAVTTVVTWQLESGYVLGKLRHLQLPALKPVQIAGLTTDAESVTIKLRDFSEFTRLHVYAGVCMVLRNHIHDGISTLDGNTATR